MTRPTAFLFLFTIVCAVSLTACQPAATTPAATPPPSSAAPADSATGSTSMRTPVPGEKAATVEQTYNTPAGEEKVAFTVFVDANGMIIDAQTKIEAKAPTSVMRQKSFAAELPTVLKGKKLKDLQNIDRVGGSSLTTGAFNKALTQLKTQV